jgi:phosphomevalonate kinase
MFSYPAQNALLKVFEEPRPGVVIFLIMPDATKLFPTLRSRLFAMTGKFAEDDEIKQMVKKFLKGDKKDRLEFVKKFTDMESKVILKEKSIKFLNFLEKEFAEETSANKKKVEDIYLAKKYIGDQGSSPKILLEHIAVTI